MQTREGTSTPTRPSPSILGFEDDEEIGRASRKDLEDALRVKWVEDAKVRSFIHTSIELRIL